MSYVVYLCQTKHYRYFFIANVISILTILYLKKIIKTKIFFLSNTYVQLRPLHADAYGQRMCLLQGNKGPTGTYEE